MGQSDTLLAYVGMRQVFVGLPRSRERLAQVRERMHRRAPLGD